MGMKARRSLTLLAALALTISLTVACSQAAPSSAPTTVPASTPASAPPAAAPTSAPAAAAKSSVKIKIGSLMDLTGPVAAAIGVEARGWADYWKYVNAEKGGIKGNEVELTSMDTKYNMDQAMTGYARLKDAKVIVSVSAMSTFEEAVKDRLAEDNILLITPGGTLKGLVPPGNLFFSNPIHPDKFLRTLDWIKANWKGANAPKVAGVTTDSAWGRGFITDETMAYAKKIGVEYVGTEFVPLVPTDTTAQLLRMKDKGVDFIFGLAAETTVAPVVRDATKLGLKDKTTLIYPDALNAPLLKQLGADANGVAGPEGTMRWDASSGVKLAQDIMKKYGQEATSESYLTGVMQAMVTEKAIELALGQVSADKLDGSTLRKNGFEKLSGFDPMGLSSPIGFTAQDHRGAIDLRFRKVVEGKIVDVEPAKRIPDVFGLGR